MAGVGTRPTMVSPFENKLANRPGQSHNRGRYQMPTYEYVCQKCHHAFELFQPMQAATLTQCPRCKKRSLKRLIGGGAGLIFKGSGFYITDYKNKKKPEKTGGGDTPAPAKTEPKAESKPAAAAR